VKTIYKGRSGEACEWVRRVLVGMRVIRSDMAICEWAGMREV